MEDGSTAPQEPSAEEFAAMCQQVKDLVPEKFGKDAWYLIIIAVLTMSPRLNLLASFYTYLSTHDPEFSQSADSKHHLSLKIRDILLKLVVIVGAPQVLCVLVPLAKAEGNPTEQAAESKLDEKWTSIDASALHARGISTINTIYGPHLLPQIFASFGSHSADVQFMELFTVYGMYLSDFTVLNPLETETVVYASIACTGLRGPSLWHTRGLGRLLGARGTDESTETMVRAKDCLRNVKVAVITVVEFVGQEMISRTGLERPGRGGWVNVGDVGRELGGWGDD